MKYSKERLAEIFDQITQAIDNGDDIDICETGSYTKSVKDGLVTRTPTGTLLFTIKIDPLVTA